MPFTPDSMSQPAPTQRMSATAWYLLITLSVIWGGSFLFIGIAVKTLPVPTIVAARLFLAALALLTVMVATGARIRCDGPALRAFLGMALLGNVIPFLLIVWGQTHITSGLASVLNATTPLFTVVIAHLFTEDALTRPRVAGILFGCAGVAVMAGPDALAGFGGNMLAQGACLLAALAYGAANIWGRRFRTLGITPTQTATGQLTMSALLMAPVALIVDQPWTLPMPDMRTVFAIVALALVCSALAYALFFRVLALAGPTNLSLVTFLVPVSAIWMGIVVLDESLLPRQIAGMALIAAGLVAVDGRLVKRWA